MADKIREEEITNNEPDISFDKKTDEQTAEDTILKTKLLFGTSKKHKAKRVQKQQLEDNNDSSDFVAPEAYKYEVLLNRIYDLIRSNNPSLQESRRFVIKPPNVQRAGTRRVAWTNFQTICQVMQRPPEHVFQFVLCELGTEGSISGEGQLILKGRYNTSNIETLLKKYITEYVTCFMCKSPQTILEKDSGTRLYNLHCKACGANRSVSSIKSGFHAVSRADRRKAKAIA